MSLAAATSIALVGLTGHVVEVQADVGGGLPGMILLGLPDASLNEARDRVRSAARNVGMPLSPRRITVNLVPAALPKRGPGFDLAILVAALAAEDRLRIPASTAFIAELGLDGGLRPVAGILPAVLAARDAGIENVVVPQANGREASLVPGVGVRPYAHLADLLVDLGVPASALHRTEAGDRVHADGPSRESAEGSGASGNAALSTGTGEPDLRDVVGQPYGRHALEVAAAGGHHLLLMGPPGAGKTMLAERLPGLLPPLSDEDAVLATCVRSLGGAAVTELLSTPPLEAPHHTSSVVALVGGGSGIPRPGAASRAHAGVLFLDEAPEFQARALDALREPLESGALTLHRAAGAATYPARFQLVMAANPCPCAKPSRECECSAQTRRRYWGRLSGPLLDRMDVRVHVPAVKTREFVNDPGGEDSATVRARVVAARARQAERWRELGVATNSRVPGIALREGRFRLDRAATAHLRRAAETGALTGRGIDRVLRVAWTVADLAGASRPGEDHVEMAAMLRGSTEAVA